MFLFNKNKFILKYTESYMPEIVGWNPSLKRQDFYILEFFDHCYCLPKNKRIVSTEY